MLSAKIEINVDRAKDTLCVWQSVANITRTGLLLTDGRSRKGVTKAL